MGSRLDGFGIDDLRSSDSGPGRDSGRSSTSPWDKWTNLQDAHPGEERTDNLAREEQVREILEQRTLTAYANRNRACSLRNSEICTLAEVGKFRVVRENDLAEFLHNRDRSRMENDVEYLVHH